MGRWVTGTCASIVAATMTLTGAHALAQDPLAAARDLYVAAAYDEALARLNDLRASNRRPDDLVVIEEYRAFCLLALGRPDDAAGAIEAVLGAAPWYRPSDGDVSPRVLAAFHDVRRRILPAIIQRKYDESKAAFDRKDRTCVEGFRQVLDLLADADLGSASERPPLSELRTLAAGYRDLSANRAAPLPAIQGAPSGVPLAQTPAVKPAAARIYSIDDADVMPPSAVRQSVAPLAEVFALRAGSVEIVVDETGSVIAAAIQTSVNAVYDRVAVSTARSWRYRPAVLNGAAVKFRMVVRLDPKPPAP